MVGLVNGGTGEELNLLHAGPEHLVTGAKGVVAVSQGVILLLRATTMGRDEAGADEQNVPNLHVAARRGGADV